MPKIRVTEECMTAIRAASTAAGGFDQTFKKLPNGDWAGDITDDDYDRLLTHCGAGQSVSDAILLALAKGSNSIN